MNNEEKLEPEKNEEDLNEQVAEDLDGSEKAEPVEAEVIDLEKDQVEELNKKILRAAADFDNLKRRTQEEKVRLLKYGSEKLLINTLPVLDNFERAIDVKDPTEEIKKFVEGMDMIYRQLMDVLAKEGLSKIEALGNQFDPELHDAVMKVEDENVEDNTIIADLRTGYLYHDKVIRPTMVQVAQNN